MNNEFPRSMVTTLLFFPADILESSTPSAGILSFRVRLLFQGKYTTSQRKLSNRQSSRIRKEIVKLNSFNCLFLPGSQCSHTVRLTVLFFILHRCFVSGIENSFFFTVFFQEKLSFSRNLGEIFPMKMSGVYFFYLP